MDVPGLILYKCYITDTDKIIQELDKEQWSNVLKRRTQHYGARYDYSLRNIVFDENIKKVKDCPIIYELATKIQHKCNSISFNQCIVNEYKSGQNISAHYDALIFGIFGDVIATTIIRNSTTMIFTNIKLKNTNEVELNDGDLLILTGESRYKWTHETKPITKKNYRRISLTYRTMKE